MIESVWPYAAVMLLSAGLFPSLENRYRWRFFSVLPPIVLSYLFVMALAVAGVWSPTPEIQGAQRTVTALILPALLFLLMVSCDLRAILAVGPRVLAVFACAFASILLSIAAVYVLFRTLLPEEGWKMLAALSATWTGGNPRTGTWREAANEWGNLTLMGNAYISENATAGNTPAPAVRRSGDGEGL